MSTGRGQLHWIALIKPTQNTLWHILGMMSKVSEKGVGGDELCVCVGIQDQ